MYAGLEVVDSRPLASGHNGEFEEEGMPSNDDIVPSLEDGKFHCRVPECHGLAPFEKKGFYR